jgi:hypothetical protein
MIGRPSLSVVVTAGQRAEGATAVDPEQRRLLQREAAEMEARVNDPDTIPWPPTGRWRRRYKHLLTEAEVAMGSEEAEQAATRRRRAPMRRKRRRVTIDGDKSQPVPAKFFG